MKPKCKIWKADHAWILRTYERPTGRLNRQGITLTEHSTFFEAQMACSEWHRSQWGPHRSRWKDRHRVALRLEY